MPYELARNDMQLTYKTRLLFIDDIMPILIVCHMDKFIHLLHSARTYYTFHIDIVCDDTNRILFYNIGFIYHRKKQGWISINWRTFNTL